MTLHYKRILILLHNARVQAAHGILIHLFFNFLINRVIQIKCRAPNPFPVNGPIHAAPYHDPA